jgi:hypothetical protein
MIIYGLCNNFYFSEFFFIFTNLQIVAVQYTNIVTNRQSLFIERRLLKYIDFNASIY